MALDYRPPVGAVVRRNYPGHDHRHLGVIHNQLYTVEEEVLTNPRNFYLVGIGKTGPGRPQWGLEYFDLVSLPKEEPTIEPWWEK